MSQTGMEGWADRVTSALEKWIKSTAREIVREELDAQNSERDIAPAQVEDHDQKDVDWKVYAIPGGGIGFRIDHQSFKIKYDSERSMEPDRRTWFMKQLKTALSRLAGSNCREMVDPEDELSLREDLSRTRSKLSLSLLRPVQRRWIPDPGGGNGHIRQNLYSEETVQRLLQRNGEIESMFRNRDGRLEEAIAELERVKNNHEETLREWDKAASARAKKIRSLQNELEEMRAGEQSEDQERTDWGVKPSELCDGCRELALNRAQKELAAQKKKIANEGASNNIMDALGGAVEADAVDKKAMKEVFQSRARKAEVKDLQAGRKSAERTISAQDSTASNKRVISDCEHCHCEAGYDLEGRCDVCRKHRRAHHMNKKDGSNER